MTVSIAICAHEKRIDAAWMLADQLDTRMVIVDDGTWGSVNNHVDAWKAALEDALLAGHEWVGVVEDDAIPVPDVADQIPAMLANAPSPLVSAYLGTSYPVAVQQDVREALRADPAWIVGADLLHHVAVFATVDVTREIIAYLEPGTPIGVDGAIGILARQKRWPVAYGVPSLFDHADERPLIPVDERGPGWAPGPRVAWRHGGRDDWAGRVVPLDLATTNYYPAFRGS